MKVIIADDHKMLTDSLQEFFMKDKDIEIIATVSNGEAAINACLNSEPDILLLDLNFNNNGINGFDAIKKIKESSIKTKIVVMSGTCEIHNIIRALKCGADTFLHKNVPVSELICIMKDTFNGIKIIHSSVKSIIFQSGLYDNIEFIQRPEYNFGFNRKQIEIIYLIKCGKRNKEIADILNIDEGVLKNKISRIYDIAGIKDDNDKSKRITLSLWAEENLFYYFGEVAKLLINKQLK